MEQSEGKTCKTRMKHLLIKNLGDLRPWFIISTTITINPTVIKVKRKKPNKYNLGWMVIPFISNIVVTTESKPTTKLPHKDEEILLKHAHSLTFFTGKTKHLRVCCKTVILH